MGGRHRAKTEPPAVSVWLGAGAIALGIGAALTTGTGVAAAETAESSGSSATSDTGGTSSADSSGGTSSADPGGGAEAKQDDTQKATAGTVSGTSEESVRPAKKKPRHQQIADASPEPQDSDGDASTTVGRPRIRPAASTVDAPERTTAPTADSNVAPASPKLTTASAAPFKAAAAPTATPANPLQQVLDNFQKAVQRALFNSPPEVTITEPTRNADGSFTGRIVASDADGDPLTISGNFFAGGRTTLDDDGNYTYTPSESALSTPGFVQILTFRVAEDNAASHFHGPAQIQNWIERTALYALLRVFGYPPYSAASWGTTSVDVRIPVGPPRV